MTAHPINTSLKAQAPWPGFEPEAQARQACMFGLRCLQTFGLDRATPPGHQLNKYCSGLRHLREFVLHFDVRFTAPIFLLINGMFQAVLTKYCRKITVDTWVVGSVSGFPLALAQEYTPNRWWAFLLGSDETRSFPTAVAANQIIFPLSGFKSLFGRPGSGHMCTLVIEMIPVTFIYSVALKLHHAFQRGNLEGTEPLRG